MDFDLPADYPNILVQSLSWRVRGWDRLNSRWRARSSSGEVAMLIARSDHDKLSFSIPVFFNPLFLPLTLFSFFFVSFPPYSLLPTSVLSLGLLGDSSFPASSLVTSPKCCWERIKQSEELRHCRVWRHQNKYLRIWPQVTPERV